MKLKLLAVAFAAALILLLAYGLICWSMPLFLNQYTQTGWLDVDASMRQLWAIFASTILIVALLAVLEVAFYVWLCGLSR